MAGRNIGGSAVTREHDEKSEWVQAHEALSRLAAERAAADAEEGRWLLAALRSAAHVHLGYGSFGEYVERLFGYKPRSTQEKLRVAEALKELPAVAHALETGALNWSAARELTRVAVAEPSASGSRSLEARPCTSWKRSWPARARGTSPPPAADPRRGGMCFVSK
jgi:hypothetical protein